MKPLKLSIHAADDEITEAWRVLELHHTVSLPVTKHPSTSPLSQTIFIIGHVTPANAPLPAQPTPAEKLLTALFISAYYTLDLNWTLICSSVTFHQPWHVVSDIPEQPAPVRARLAVRFRRDAGEVQPPLSWLRAWHTPLHSPLAPALHLQSASRSLMSQHTSHPIWAAFNDASLPHTCQHTHTHVLLPEVQLYTHLSVKTYIPDSQAYMMQCGSFKLIIAFIIN